MIACFTRKNRLICCIILALIIVTRTPYVLLGCVAALTCYHRLPAHIRRRRQIRAHRIVGIKHLGQYLTGKKIVVGVATKGRIRNRFIALVIACPNNNRRVLTQTADYLYSLTAQSVTEIVALRIRGAGHTEILPYGNTMAVAEIIEQIVLINITAPTTHDIATDIVLHRAAELSARVILSTPCCHRALSRLVNQEALRFVTRYGKLSDKLCEALTDGLRLLYLEGEGYSTSAYELVDPDDTPKNTLLVAIKKKESDEQKRMAYANTLRYVLGEKADSYLNGLI